MPSNQAITQNGINGKEGSVELNNGFGSQGTKNGHMLQDAGHNSGDSEDVFEDEEITSSECNSEDSGYS